MVSAKTNDEPVVFNCDLEGQVTALPHFWEHTVGSCHAAMALRADWQAQLARCRQELGFRHVRFHGLLSDDMGTVNLDGDKLVYSFFNTDQIWDFLLSIGMKPFIELSFMPGALSSGRNTVFHYKGNVTPPKHIEEWDNLIYKLVSHWVDRYGIEEVAQWYFEVWNEPNLSEFWKGTQKEYFKLYQHTAIAVKKVNALLRIGGPATAKSGWIPEFLDFCTARKVPVDFITTHHYPNDMPGEEGKDNLTQLAHSHCNLLTEEAVKARVESRGLPLFYTEWSSSSDPFDELHDMPYAASFIVKTIMQATGVADGYSYWTFSDIFEENYLSSVPFHGGFGLVNIYGVPKPAFRAFEMLHRLGTEQLIVSGKHATVDVWVVKSPKIVHLIVTNWALPGHTIAAEKVRIALGSLPPVKKAYLERIDDVYANARTEWLKMGRPDSLSPMQVLILEAVSVLTKKNIDINNNDEAIFVETTIPAFGTVLITLELL